jgi:hypothetical protein
LIQFDVVVKWEIADDVLNGFTISITDTMDSHSTEYSGIWAELRYGNVPS